MDFITNRAAQILYRFSAINEAFEINRKSTDNAASLLSLASSEESREYLAARLRYLQAERAALLAEQYMLAAEQRAFRPPLAAASREDDQE